ncbi:alpha/beta fold hydrolase [Chryseobacterium caseinilyticum]|uniref:Alpha/beta hydrolase n=1 Tax=Chryseobacterium caseinilyticum TaxID=2771428 RepID=A0ABR8ZD39_9FLAO|nr:alpha/beta hydrolase [Chryseobacterium caseinilyticum]MBD8082810.1 alpha/beta hydrolase [Chryseobacterium caseinilyticum]
MTLRFLKQNILISFFILLISMSAFGQEIKGLRYFMQGNAIASSIPYGNNVSAGHYVKSDDAKIYYEVYGKGSPIVVLHGGIVGSPSEMGQLIDSLSQKHQVISISTRGHGRSEMGNKIPSYEQKAKDVNAVLDKVNKDKVTIVGFSDGAYTGYFFAEQYPDRIEKLVAIGAGEWKKGFREFKMDYKTFSAMDELFWKQQMAIRPEPKRVDEWFSTLSNYYSNLNIDKYILGQIKCPVLVMAGEKDQNAPFETVIAAYKMIPNAQLAIIPNAPHPAFLVNFAAVWADMKPFLDQNN